MNLVSGMVGIYYVLNGQLEYGAYFVLIAAFFDFLDGFAARILKVHSEIGKQLDSLADMVTFGALPAFILFEWIGQVSTSAYLPFTAFLIAVFSAFRLAKFNIDTRQSDRFLGVPTPANALLISTLPFFVKQFPIYGFFLNDPYVLVFISLTMSILLVLEIPMIALKFSGLGFASNIWRYSILAIGLASLVLFGLAGIPITIIFYISLSIIESVIIKND